ncbi:MAG: LamG domain-containing protein, partial [Planctomycetota bacterium]
QIPYLRAVYLKGSGVTEQGVNRLHAAKPWCEIHSDFASFPEPPIEGRASLRFSGIHSHVDIPTLRYDATHPITIEASVRREPPLGEYAELITNGMTTEGPPCAVLNWNRESGWLFTVMADEPQSASHPEPAPGPLRIAGVWDGSQLSLYFDGQLVSRREYSATPDDDRQPGHFVIGAEQTLNGIDRYFHFLGVIDEVRISSVARYADDYTPVDRFETDRHTMALYHFDEGQGDVLIDSSGNNHHGRIIGGVWITRE